jgi:hypothetical protein
MKFLKVLQIKWWDAFPAVAFFAVAAAEGKAYWVGGVALIWWGFVMAIRYLVK